MFLDKWGFGPPPPAYQVYYDTDLETVRWAIALKENDDDD